MPAIVFILFVFVVFLCVNIYLWTLPLSQVQLLLFAAPLGTAFFLWLLWLVAGERPRG